MDKDLLNRIQNLTDEQRKELEEELGYSLEELVQETDEFNQEEAAEFTDIQALDKQEYYIVSSSQKRIFTVCQLDGTGTAYNIPLIMEIEGYLDKRRLQDAFCAIVQRHESLRTYFEIQDDRVVQKINEDLVIRVNFVELLAGENEEKFIDAAIRPFDLSTAPLIRVTVIRKNENQHIIVIDVHHIAADGISVDIMLSDLKELYEGRPLQPLRLQYKDYALWQNESTKKGLFKKQEDYWKKVFSEPVPILELPMDYKRPLIQSFEGDRIDFVLSQETTEMLKGLTAKTGTTLYMLLFCVYNILMYKYTSQEDLVVGTPFSGRTHADLQDIIGMFVNTLAIRSYPEGKKTFLQYLEEVKQTTLKAFDNQDCQFEDLTDKLPSKRDMSRNPLFDTMFVFEDVANTSIQLGGLVFKKYSKRFKFSKFDLTLIASEENNRLHFQIEYCVKLFARDTIKRLTVHLQELITSILRNPHETLENLNILSSQEKRQLLEDFCSTDRDYNKEKTIQELFEEQVKEVPEKIAVFDEDKKLTYSLLNTQAYEVAKILVKKGVTAGTLVAVTGEPSATMIIGIIGILKAGGAYLPISDNYPKSRVEYMLEDSKTTILLCTSKLEYTPEFNGEILIIDEMLRETAFGETCSLVGRSTPQDLAYVIYTSGSTGKPKGVMAGHIGVANLKSYFEHDLKINKEDNILQFASISFDASVWEIMMALLTGGTLCIPKKDTINDLRKMEKFINDNNITVATLPPAYAVHLESDNIHALKLLITAGSETTDAIVKKWSSKLQYINAYGPTETTVCATYWRANEANTEVISIGKPIPNTKVYILDKKNQLVPIGVRGQICISGDGLAKGYLNQPELTRMKFIEHPFLPNEKMYLTGDVGKWTPDGLIQFMGRQDYQVKIRGFRIELGEIEEQLLKIEQIKETIVLDKQDSNNNKYLVAFYTGIKELDAAYIKRHLSKELPDYMIPSYFVKTEELPLTQNGKVDRKALLELQLETGNGENIEYSEPRNKVESNLCKIWKQILNAKQIGIDDSFFDLGGDSIKAIQIASRLNKYKMKLEIKDLLSNPTIREVASYVREIGAANIVDEALEGEVALSPIQEWFFEQKLKKENHWNQAVLLYKSEGFSEDIVKRVFDKIIKQHDTLRMTFTRDKDKVRQYLRNPLKETLYTYEVQNIASEENIKAFIEKTATGIQKELDLEKGPLVKLGLFQTQKGDYLLIVIHHLVVDAVSFRIIMEDFVHGYKQIQAGRKVELFDKTCSYRQWTNALRDYAKAKELQGEKQYWKDIVAQYSPLPVDNEVITRKVFNSNNIEIVLGETETKQFLREAHKAYSTEANDLLLSALGLALQKWIGISSIIVNMEGHGREKIGKYIDVSRTVGWFTSQYPLLLDMKNTDMSCVIKKTKETIRNIPDKGIGYQIIKYLGEDTDYKELAYANEISFNYLGEFGQDIDKEVVEISDFGVGECSSTDNESLWKIGINGSITGGKLKFQINYDRREYKEDNISEFAKIYMNELLAVISHCVNKKERELTPYDVGASKISLTDFEEIGRQYPLNEIQSIYRLTPMQEGLFFHYLKDENPALYFEQLTMNVEEELNPDIIQKSFNYLTQKYDVFRTLFIYKNIENALQIVFKNMESKVSYQDISNYTEIEKEKYIEKVKKQEIDRGFFITKEKLVRLSFIKVRVNEFKMIWNFHHIIMDGWCLGIILKDFFEAYGSLALGKEIKHIPVTEYKNYIEWLEKQDKEFALRYWKNYLEEYAQPAKPLHMRKKDKGYAKEEYLFSLDKDTTTDLKNIAQRNQVTLNSVFLSVWAILLQRYNNSDDVSFGSVVSCRPTAIEGIEDMVGLFINTLPVRVKSGKEITFIELLKKVNSDFMISNEYSYCSLAEIQSLMALKDSLINHIMVFENYPVEMKAEHFGVYLSKIEAHEQANYDFNIIIGPGEETIIKFSYNKRMYDQHSIIEMAGHFQQLIVKIIKNPLEELDSLDILTENEKKELLIDFNNTERQFIKDKTIQELFEEVVKQKPDYIAVQDEDKKLTYIELNEKANTVADFLVKMGVEKGKIVAVTGERTVEVIIGILGILKAGGAYLPIDYTYPVHRIDYMLQDSKTDILLCCSDIECNMKFDGKIVYYTDINASFVNEYFGEGSIRSKAEDTAYVIYTSGSTGKPKGVMVNHIGVANLKDYFQKDLKIFQRDNILQFASLSFDASVWEFTMALLIGGTLSIPSKDTIGDFRKLEAYINKNNITIATLPPAYVTYLESDKIHSLRKLITAGSETSEAIVDKWSKTREYINAYGPTEATVCATVCTDCAKQQNRLSIGKPISNFKVYVLDKFHRLVPKGVAGQLCISGVGLAKGYLNQEKLTNEKFIPNPFLLGEKMYLTGDLARWLPDGNLEFLGRMDYQVKIRGFRIELGEIKTSMLKHEQINEVAVIDKEDSAGNRYLVAYYTASQELEKSEIKKVLIADLPDYMIPSYFVYLSKMPLTRNGKIDRKALLTEGIERIEAYDFEVAGNITEEKILAIWKEILGSDKVGINDNFFEIGGHSLKATLLLSRIYKEFNVVIPIKQLYILQTVKEIAAYIKNCDKTIYCPIETVEKRTYYPVSSVQKRLFTINMIDKESLVYNMPFVMKIKGEVDYLKFKNIFETIIQRHEALRTSFEMVGNEIYQKIHDKVATAFDWKDLKENETIDSAICEFIRPFRLKDESLIRIRFIMKSQNEHFMMIDMHHIICDGVSMNIILREMAGLHQGQILPENRVQYKDFTEWKEKNRDKGQQEEFWINEFKGKLPDFELPLDYERGAIQQYEGNRIQFAIDKATTEKLNILAKETGSTLYMVLLAAYTILLHKYSGEEDIIVGSILSGRNHPDIQDTVGMFVNTIAIRNYPTKEKTIIQYLGEVREKVLNVLENQDYELETLLNNLDIKKAAGRNPLFDTMFALQNIEMTSLNIDNLVFEDYEVPLKISKFDITFNGVEQNECLYFDVEYCIGLYKRDTIEQITIHYSKIVEAMVKNREQLIGDINLVGENLTSHKLDNLNELDFIF